MSLWTLRANLILVALLIAGCDSPGALPPSDNPGTPPVITSVSPTGDIGYEGAEVIFSAVVEGDVTEWHWDFGGGTVVASADIELPRMILGPPGTYEGTLTLGSDAGSSAPWEFEFTVLATVSVPRIEGVTPTAGLAGQLATFLANASGGAIAWEWNFGEGASPSSSTLPTPEVTFRLPGSYEGSVIVDTVSGPIPAFSFTYTVDPNPGATLAPYLRELTPCGSAGRPGSVVQFAADAFFFPTEWDWDFGPTATPRHSNERAPVITLGPEGYHEGGVTLTNARGTTTCHFTYMVGDLPPASPAAGWSSTLGGQFHRVSVAPDGSIYVLGQSSILTDLDPSPGSCLWTRVGKPFNPSTFLARLNPGGDLAWIRRWDYTDRPVYPGGCVADAGGVTLLLGTYLGLDLDPSNGVYLLPVQVYRVPALLRLSAAGELGWAYAVSTGEGVIAGGLDVGPSGDIYTSSFQFPRVRFFCFGPGGTPRWERFISMTATDTLTTHDIAADSTGGAIWGGALTGQLDLAPGDTSDVHAATGARDSFLVALDADGGYRWGRAWGGSGDWRLNVSELVSPPTGGAIVRTRLGGTAAPGPDLDPGAGVTGLSSPGHLDALSRFDSTGALLWARSLTISNFESANGYGVALSGGDLVWLSAVYNVGLLPTIDLDPDPAVTRSLTGRGALVAGYDLDGNLIRALSWAEADQSYGLAADGQWLVHVASMFGPQIDADPGAEVTSLDATEGARSYLLRLHLNGTF